ncbi:MAG: exosortase system-associated protein, TIGR04073 family [Candidatus Sumerlaeia bacterium]|nr:exosortase system-associated protein, TIGR04073 family [Candidatus Sumerlaeia bacterium]
MRKRRLLGLVLMGFALSLAVPTVPATGPLYEHSRSARMTRKLGRGVLNVLFFWCEIPHHINQDARNTDFFTGVLTGTGKGIVAGGRRLVLGLYDVFTFPVEIPRNYEDVQQTEFVFESDID